MRFWSEHTVVKRVLMGAAGVTLLIIFTYHSMIASVIAFLEHGSFSISPWIPMLCGIVPLMMGIASIMLRHGGKEGRAKGR